MLFVLMYGFYFTALFVMMALLLVDLYGCYLDYQEDKRAEQDLNRFYALYSNHYPAGDKQHEV